jgi:hypothetical protein
MQLLATVTVFCGVKTGKLITTFVLLQQNKERNFAIGA